LFTDLSLLPQPSPNPADIFRDLLSPVVTAQPWPKIIRRSRCSDVITVPVTTHGAKLQEVQAEIDVEIEAMRLQITVLEVKILRLQADKLS
jgi:hypothetical protein